MINERLFMSNSMAASCRVRLQVNSGQVNGGQVYQGDIPVHDVVHLALDRLLPHAVLKNHRLSVYKGGDLIYPDMFLYEILAHYATPISPWRPPR